MLTLNDPGLLKADAFINGVFVPAKTDARFVVTNPANGQNIAKVADFGADGIATAIDAAEAAGPAWAARTAKDRAASAPLV